MKRMKIIAAILMALIAVLPFVSCGGNGDSRQALATPTGLDIDADTFTLQWSAVSGAAGYEVDISGPRTLKETVTDEAYPLGRLANDHGVYSIRVKALAQSGSPLFRDSGYSTKEVEPAEYIFVFDDTSSPSVMRAVGGGRAITGLTNYGKGLSNIVIPSSYKGQDVTDIGDNAFAGGSSVASVVIPPTIVVIGANAFSGTSITEIDIPASVTEIGNGAFSGLTLVIVILNWNAADLNNVNISDAFEGAQVDTISVPEGTSDAYEEALPPEVKDAVTEDTYYTVTFDANGGILSGSTFVAVKENDKVARPENDPERNGYVFDGWLLANAPYDFNTEVTGNITLIAQWTAIPADDPFELWLATLNTDTPRQDQLASFGFTPANWNAISSGMRGYQFISNEEGWGPVIYWTDQNPTTYNSRKTTVASQLGAEWYYEDDTYVSKGEYGGDGYYVEGHLTTVALTENGVTYPAGFMSFMFNGYYPGSGGPGDGGTLTLTGIPEEYNGKWTRVDGYNDIIGDFAGCTWDSSTEEWYPVQISNRSVSLPLWIEYVNGEVSEMRRYNGNDTAAVVKFAICNDPEFENTIAEVVFYAVTFSNGSATITWDQADAIYEGGEPGGPGDGVTIIVNNTSGTADVTGYTPNQGYYVVATGGIGANAFYAAASGTNSSVLNAVSLGNPTAIFTVWGAAFETTQTGSTLTLGNYNGNGTVSFSYAVFNKASITWAEFQELRDYMNDEGPRPSWLVDLGSATGTAVNGRITVVLSGGGEPGGPGDGNIIGSVETSNRTVTITGLQDYAGDRVFVFKGYVENTGTTLFAASSATTSGFETAVIQNNGSVTLNVWQLNYTDETTGYFADLVNYTGSGDFELELFIIDNSKPSITWTESRESFDAIELPSWYIDSAYATGTASTGNMTAQVQEGVGPGGPGGGDAWEDFLNSLSTGTPTPEQLAAIGFNQTNWNAIKNGFIGYEVVYDDVYAEVSVYLYWINQTEASYNAKISSVIEQVGGTIVGEGGNADSIERQLYYEENGKYNCFFIC